MEGNNKKKKNYYYKNNNQKKHNNHNKKYYQHYYKKNKNKKNNNYVTNNSEVHEENILLSINNSELQEQIDIVNKEQNDIGEPRQVTQEVLNANYDYEEYEFVPIKKKDTKKYQNRYKLMYVFGAFIIVAIVFGVSYSFFTYTKVDSRQADIASGEVYVRIEDESVNLTLNKMYPRTAEEARARSDNYIDFTIEAKNTSPTKEVKYTLNITNGEDVQGKTRINPQYLIMELQEKVGNEYQYIKEAEPLSTFDFEGIVPVNTTSEIEKEYRLRIWISDAITISDTEANASYTQSEFANLYANIHIEVNSLDSEHVPVAYDVLANNVTTGVTINFGNVSSSSNGEGIYLLPGTGNNTYPIYFYRGNINNNNVIFGGYCWQMVRTTDTGGIKMIYNGAVTGTTESPTCENTTVASRTLPSNSRYNLSYKSVSDVGYMSNARYEYLETAPTSGAYFGTSVEYGEYDTNNPGTNVYRLVDDGNGSVGTSLTANRHYSCDKTTSTGICAQVRYYYYNNGENYRYISLSNGETIDDALYKMTGIGSSSVQQRNSGYVLNQNNSMIKSAVEDWFKTNLTNEVDNTKTDYRVYLEDTIYCNDRSFKTNGSSNTYTQSGWNPNNGNLTTYLYYGTNNRFSNGWYSTTNVPSVTCPNETDSFSVSSSVAHLNYPVGLINIDEIIMAGASGNHTPNNETYYLYMGNFYWGMSPYYLSAVGANMYGVGTGGYVGSNTTNAVSSVRPVISLKYGLEFVDGGNGTPTNPYVVKYD